MFDSHELKQQIESLSLEPTILSYADSNHYLVGAEDNEGNFYALMANNKTRVFNSMFEAENCLRELGIMKAILHMQTAYDEMVGSATNQDVRVTMNLSRD